MFLPGTMIALTGMEIDAATGVPLPVYIKPDNIVSLCIRNASAVSPDDENKKVRVTVTTILMPYQSQVTVMETPQQIMEAVVKAFNDDVQQIKEMQRINALAMPGGSLPRM